MAYTVEAFEGLETKALTQVGRKLGEAGQSWSAAMQHLPDTCLRGIDLQVRHRDMPT
jgi:hypothetical protein